jgi:hypothetical protein
VSDVATPDTSSDTESAVVLIFAVTDDPAAILSPLNVVPIVPPMVLPAPVNRTPEVPGVNVPPLFIQLVAILILVAVPAANIPDVRVNVPPRVSVAVLPLTLSVCAVFATVMLPNVCVAAVPLIACADVVLLNVTVFAPGVKVPPLFVQLPATFVFAPAVRVPAVRVAFPLMLKVAGDVKLPRVIVRLFTVRVVVLPPTVRAPAALLTVRSLNVWLTAVPLIACATPLLNVTVLVPGVNVPPLFVQLFPALIVVPAVNVPAVNVARPVMVIVVGAVKLPAVRVNAPLRLNVVVLPPTLSVCPVLFTTRALNV